MIPVFKLISWEEFRIIPFFLFVKQLKSGNRCVK